MVEEENVFIFCKNCFQPAVMESEPKYPELSLIGSALSVLYQNANCSPLSHVSIHIQKTFHLLWCNTAIKDGRNGWHFNPASLDHQHCPNGQKRNISNRIALSKSEQESPQAMNWVSMISYYHFNSSTSLFCIPRLQLLSSLRTMIDFKRSPGDHSKHSYTGMSA